MKKPLINTIAMLLMVSGMAYLPACAPGPNTPTNTQSIAGPGQGTIKGVVSADGIKTSAFRMLLQAKPGKGGKVKCSSGIDTKEVDVADDGSFSAVVKGGAEYTVEATVPDGKGGTYKAVAKVNVPLAQDPQVADIGSLVTRRTGSLQGLIELKDAKTGDTAVGADVFLSGGTSVVGKAGDTGRFTLANVPEGTWNVVVMKPGYKRQVVQGVVVKAGRPTLINETVVLERESNEAKAGIKGVVQDGTGKAILGATVSAFPKDRAMLAGSDAGLDNFSAVSDESGNFEMLNLPPGEYQLQVYRPFYNLPPRQDVKVEANVTTDVGTVKMQSSVVYFGKISAKVIDADGNAVDGAVGQINPPVTEAQFADANGSFTLDRVMPGEYTMSISAGGYTTVEVPLRMENLQNFNVALDDAVVLQRSKPGPVGSDKRTLPPVIVRTIPDPIPAQPAPVPSTVAPAPAPNPQPVPAPPAVNKGEVITIAGGPSAGYVNGTGAGAQFHQPIGIAIDGKGMVYVLDHHGGRVRKMTASGQVSLLAGSGSWSHYDAVGEAASFYLPCGLGADTSGNVYVGDRDTGTVRKVTPAGVTITLAGYPYYGGLADGQGTNARFSGPHGVAVDSKLNVYVADTNNHCIRKVTPDGEVITLAGSGVAGKRDGSGAAGQFNSPMGVTVDAAGNVYVADTGNHQIRKIDPSGNVTTIAGAGVVGFADGQGRGSQFSSPAGIAVDKSGNLYVADRYNHVVRLIDTNGMVTTLAGSGLPGFADGVGNEAQFNEPFGIGVDASGAVYVADFNNHRVRKIQ